MILRLCLVLSASLNVFASIVTGGNYAAVNGTFALVNFSLAIWLYQTERKREVLQ